MKQAIAKVAFLFVAFSFLCVPMASAGKLERMARRLGLSSAQKAKIQKIVYEARRKQITLRASLQLARLDLHQLVKAHKPDEAKVIAAIDKAAKFEVEMKKSRILMMVRVKAVLSAKQAAQLAASNERKRARRRRMRKAFRRWRRNRRRGRRGRRGPRMGGGGGK